MVDAKFELIAAECQKREVEFQHQILVPKGTVFDTLVDQIAAGPSNYLICGTRSHRSRLGILSGTVSERLLRLNRFHVMAVRVNLPGLLGLPRDLLLPVSGHPRGFLSGMPFLKLLGEDVGRMHILYVQRVSKWRYRVLSQDAAEQLRRAGQRYSQRVEGEISDQLGLGHTIMDTHVVVSDDVPKEIVIAATKTRSKLIYLGASERNLTQRILYGNPIEQVLRDATCDVAIYRGAQ
jgi:nucleotide-binding universal stress UspA family protein